MTRLRLLGFVLSLVFAMSLAMVSGPAFAQSTADGPSYDKWETVATFTENAVEANRASTTSLENLRSEIALWRQQFQDAQKANGNAIASIQAQLEALGPAPEDGSESEEVATQRAELTDRLFELQAPVKRAELAYSRADSLIAGIDTIIRERQAEELLELGPSPLSPTHWKEAVSAVVAYTKEVRNEISTAWASPTQRAEAKEDLPAVFVLLLLGLVLLFRGRKWSRRLSNHVLTDQPGAGRWLGAFMISLGSLILPFLGYVALAQAAYATNLVGLRGDQFLRAVMPAIFVFLMTRWVATRIFPAREARTLPLNLTENERHQGRWYGATLGLVAAGYFIFMHVGEISDWSAAASSVLQFPFLVLAGVLLLRLAGLLRSHISAEQEEAGETSLRVQIARVLALALSVLSVLSPVLAAIGYATLSHYLMFPPMASLLLLAALLILQRLVVEIFVLLSGNREGAAESLVPILIGFGLVMLSLPLFALIWGARVADLTELWTQFMGGMSIGGIRISPANFLTFVAVFTIGYMMTRLIQGAMRNTVLPKTKIDTGGRTAIVSGIGYLGIFLAAVVAITSAGLDLSSIAIVAGALSVGIGFGLQTVVSNFVSGIILLIERPISEGDWISVGGTHGYVRDISVRATRIETFDRSDVIVPNADLISGTVTNYTRGNTVGRVIVPVGVAYGTDTKKVEKILRDVAEAHPMVLANPAPNVLFRGFGADSLDFEIRAILRDVNWMMSVHSDMNHEIARIFADEGIEIPFAQRDLWLRNPEVLEKMTAAGVPRPAQPDHAADVSDDGVSEPEDKA